MIAFVALRIFCILDSLTGIVNRVNFVSRTMFPEPKGGAAKLVVENNESTITPLEFNKNIWTVPLNGKPFVTSR